MDKLLISIIATFLIAGGAYFVFQSNNQNKPQTFAEINNFDECAKIYPVTGTNPLQCKTTDGKSFTKAVGNAEEMAGQIVVKAPEPNAVIKSPLTITGKARGNWFFEAQFPVILDDADKNELARGIARADSDWMTTDFVPFTAAMEFADPNITDGFLILKNDNPSGDEKNSKQLVIPVKFSN